MQPPLPAAGAGRPSAPSTAPSASAPPGPSGVHPDGDADIPRPEHPRPGPAPGRVGQPQRRLALLLRPPEPGRAAALVPHPAPGRRRPHGRGGKPGGGPLPESHRRPLPLGEPPLRGRRSHVQRRGLVSAGDRSPAGVDGRRPFPRPCPRRQRRKRFGAPAGRCSPAPPGRLAPAPHALLRGGGLERQGVGGRALRHRARGGLHPLLRRPHALPPSGPPGHPDRARLGRLRRRHPAGEAGGRVVHPLRGDLAAGLAGGTPRGLHRPGPRHPAPGDGAGQLRRRRGRHRGGRRRGLPGGGDFGGRGLPPGRDTGGGHVRGGRP